MDHTQFLGETLPEIAFEKAGVIKTNVPVVIGEFQMETFPIFEGIAKEKNAPLFLASKNDNSTGAPPTESTTTKEAN